MPTRDRATTGTLERGAPSPEAHDAQGATGGRPLSRPSAAGRVGGGGPTAAGPPRGRVSRSLRGRSHRRGRRVTLALLAASSLALVTVGGSVAKALTAPGTDSTSARLAEWARDHHLGPAVTWLEEGQYRVSPPERGGHPDLQRYGLGSAGPAAAACPTCIRSVVAVHAPLVPLVTPALPGEGAFRTVVTSHGRGVVQVAYLRADPVHTSYLTGVAWLDRRGLRFVLHPGYAVPGHRSWWSQPTSLARTNLASVAATFNSGFKLADCRCGYFADGHTVGTLVPGDATVVFHRDGRVTVGAWGTEVSMSADVVTARQNLHLLVDHGQVTPAVGSSSHRLWGATIRGADFVWRSGVGVTGHGDLIYVAGPTLSVRSLAQVLQRAGTVRAMELDINPSWVDFMWYRAGTDGTVTPVRLVPFRQPATRYLSPSSRDFVAAILR